MSGDLDFFEGSEKLLEIWWETPLWLTAPTTASDAAVTMQGTTAKKPYDLRSIPRKKIEKFLKLAQCKILNVIENDHMVAYLLSESSLYISRNRLILKTCGTTALLNATISILKVAGKECGLTKVKVEVLDQLFPGGDAYTLGRQNSGNCWHLFTIDNCIDGFEISDQTLEILMNDLDPTTIPQYYKGYYNDVKELTKRVGIFDLIDGFTIDDYLFEPCGYSANGISKDTYFTIHVTPQREFSYASFETNIGLKSFKNLIEKVLNIFKPGRFIMTLFGNSKSPCGPTINTFEQQFVPYRRHDLHFAPFKNYNLTYGYYELS